MEFFLAIIVGLVVACVVFVLGRILVGSSTNVTEAEPRLSAFAQFPSVAPAAANAIVEDIREMPYPNAYASEQKAIEPKKKARKRGTSEHAVSQPRSPRSRKSRNATLSGTDVVQ